MKLKFDRKWIAIAVAVVFVLLISMWFFRREGYDLTSADHTLKLNELRVQFDLTSPEFSQLETGVRQYIDGKDKNKLPFFLTDLNVKTSMRGKRGFSGAVMAKFSSAFTSPPVVKKVLTLDDINKINTLIREFNIDPLDHESLRKGILDYKDKKQRPLMPVDIMVLEPKYNGLFSIVQDRFFPVSTSQQSATAQGGQLELVSGNMGPPPLPQVFKGFRCEAF